MLIQIRYFVTIPTNETELPFSSFRQMYRTSFHQPGWSSVQSNITDERTGMACYRRKVWNKANIYKTRPSQVCHFQSGGSLRTADTSLRRRQNHLSYAHNGLLWIYWRSSDWYTRWVFNKSTTFFMACTLTYQRHKMFNTHVEPLQSGFSAKFWKCTGELDVKSVRNQAHVLQLVRSQQFLKLSEIFLTLRYMLCHFRGLYSYRP